MFSEQNSMKAFICCKQKNVRYCSTFWNNKTHEEYWRCEHFILNN